MRRFFQCLTLCILTCIFALPAQAVTFKIASNAPEGTAWMNDMRAVADRIAFRTEKRVQIKYFGGGVMGNGNNVLRKIRIGQLQGSMFTFGQLSDVCPDLRLYSLPFIYRNDAEMNAVRKELDPILHKKLKSKGFETFHFAAGGAAFIMSDEPMTTLDGLRKKKVWIPQGDTMSYAVMDALGIAPVTLPITDVLTGLQAGLVDIIAAPPLGAIVMQWHTRTKALTKTPITYTFGVLGIAQKAFAKLNPKDQNIVREELNATMRAFDAGTAHDNTEALKVLKSRGMDIVELTPQDVNKIRGITEKVMQDLADKGAFDATLYARIQKKLSTMRGGQ